MTELEDNVEGHGAILIADYRSSNGGFASGKRAKGRVVRSVSCNQSEGFEVNGISHRRPHTFLPADNPALCHTSPAGPKSPSPAARLTATSVMASTVAAAAAASSAAGLSVGYGPHLSQLVEASGDALHQLQVCVGRVCV